MNLASIPYRIRAAFANAGSRNTIPVASSGTPGAASFADGFPVLTETPIGSGGIPPSRQDMNGILFDATDAARWAAAGGMYSYDATYSADVGGYPKGAILQGTGSNTLDLWQSLVDNNTVDPETGGFASNWMPIASEGFVQVNLTTGTVTLTPTQYAKPVIVFVGTLTGNVQVVFPAIVRNWTISNGTVQGGFTITMRQAAGPGYVAPEGNVTMTYATGAGMYPAFPNATENYSGIAQIATQTETDVSADDTVIVTPKKLGNGFAISLTKPGYVKLPSWLGGLIVQWGQSAGTSQNLGSELVNFPIAFPNNVFTLQLTANNPAGTVLGADVVPHLNAASLSQFRILVQSCNSGSDGFVISSNWFAIGY